MIQTTSNIRQACNRSFPAKRRLTPVESLHQLHLHSLVKIFSILVLIRWYLCILKDVPYFLAGLLKRQLTARAFVLACISSIMIVIVQAQDQTVIIRETPHVFKSVF